MAYTVYKISNITNDKFYIGYTSKTLTQRFSQHSYYRARSNSLIKKAIHKYGKDNFKIEPLHVFDSILEATQYEMKLIHELCPHYNLSKGKVEYTNRLLTKGFSKEGMASLRSPKSESMKTKIARPITLVKDSTVITFVSTYEASKYIGVSNGMISQVKTGYRPTANGWSVYNGETS